MISVVSLGVIVGVLNLNNNINALNNNKIEDQEVTKGITIIKELEAQDVLESEEKIELVQKGLQGINTNKNNGEVDFVDKFSSSVILGDSRAESIVLYEILNSSSVVAYKGRNLITAQKEGDIDTAINLVPKNIFLTYGLNDTGIYGNPSDFIKEYEKIIKYIQNRLPNTKIYVNSIFNVSNGALAKQPHFKKISQFNVAILDMCNRLGLTYIDGSSIVDSSLYEVDGVHFKPQFNKSWLKLLIEKANL